MPTEWNKLKKIQGLKNNPISTNKKRYIKIKKFIQKEHKKSLHENKKTTVYTSALKRTIETAIFFEFKNFKISKKLNELNVGTAEGMPKDLFYKQLNISKKKIEIKGHKKIENKKNFERRIISFLKETKRFDEVICFCHGIWLKYLHCLLKNLNFNKIKNINIKNADVFIYSSKNKNLKKLII